MKQRKTSHPRVGVIIPAGGSGTRMGGPLLKQFLPLRGSPILLRTLRAFDGHPDIDEIVVAGPAGFLARIRGMVARGGFVRVTGVVEGGGNRQASVENALRALSPGITIVLVHDAVRPLVEPRVISQVIESAARWGAAAAAAPALDTVHWEGAPGFFTRTLARRRIWNVQTPQGFRRAILEEAHRRARRSGLTATDDASLILRLGRRVRIVESSPRNLKITSPDDLRTASALIGRQEARK
jgi:2-C-methyl-D-erythritol 4-phosphate cytidylyltransferase